MKEKIKKNEKTKNKILEIASDRLAEIFVAQIEFQRNKNKNNYDRKRKF